MTIKEALNQNIPASEVSTRSQGGKELSYLEGWRVIDRLNKVFGQGHWQYETVKIERTYEGAVSNSRGQSGRGVAYLATVTLTAEMDDESVVQFTDVGAGSGLDYGNGLQADESAAKEAVTDGLKRCAKNLGMSMGLALYDKTQEHVDEDDHRTSGQPKLEAIRKPTQETQAKVGSSSKGASERSIPASRVETKPITKEILVSAYEVLKAQKKITPESFTKTYMLGKKIKDASDIEVSVAVGMLNTDFPELKLE